MKKAIVSSLALSLFLTGSIAAAEETTPRHRWVGAQMDLGVPDGAAFGLLVRPIKNECYDWFRLNLSATYNLSAPGIRAGITFDPIRFPIAPTLTVEGGHAFSGKVPIVSKSPDLDYNYVNLHLGLEFGNRDVWRFFLRGGLSYMDLHTGNFSNTLNTNQEGLTVGDPSINGWIAPTAKLGFSLYF